MNPLEDTESAKESAEARGQRLKLVRELLGLTLHEFSDKFDVGVSTISHWEHARANGLSPKGATKIIKRATELGLRINRSWLLYGMGEAPHPNEDNYNETINTNENYTSGSNSTTIQELQFESRTTFTVTDLVHAPILLPGDKIYGQNLTHEQFQPNHSQLYIVQSSDGRVLLRFIDSLTESKLAKLRNKPKDDINSVVLEEVSVVKIAVVKVIVKASLPDRH